MKILVVGSGGREHALCWSIAASPLCKKLYCAPGNAGIASEAECVPIGAENLMQIVNFATFWIPIITGIITAANSSGS